MKLAMLTSGLWPAEDLFPEHFPDTVIEDDGGDLPDDAKLDLSGVKWVAPAEGSGEDAYARDLAAFLSANSETVQDDEPRSVPVVPSIERSEWT